MNTSIILGLVNNAALLLTLGLLYDMFKLRPVILKPIINKIVAGIVLGLIGIALMFNPLDFGYGVIFDTRSVLLCISGFFFGTLPVILAMLITGAFRLYLGGAGAVMGIGVIITSGFIAVLWRYFRRHKNEYPGMPELYALGISVHIAMLLWMLTLPDEIASEVFYAISLPVIIIYPVTVAALGKLIINRETRLKSEEALRASENLLTNLARLVPGVIYQFRLYKDGRSAFPYSSPGMYDIYEVTPEEVQKDATPVYSRLHPEDYDMIVNAIMKSAETLQTFYSSDFRVILPKQGLRWRWCQAQPERMEDGSTLWHGIILDVTDRKNAELEQQRLQAKFLQAQKLESVGRLAGGVAHDFNNMLNVIQGYSQLSLEHINPGDPLRHYIEEILQAAGHSADITRQLLAFSRRQSVTPKVIDINETIEGMLKMLRILIGEDVNLLWHPGENIWPVKMDSVQLDQILVNLCVNARDAIQDVGMISIETGNKTFDETYCTGHAGFTPGDFVQISVSDNGSGMDEEIQKKIFEPFFTTKGVGKGTGLGLSTIYGIVKQNSGFINIYSEPGTGSVFRIYLPGHFETPATVNETEIQQVEPQGCETILLVEDEKNTLTMTMIMLERLGYNVLCVVNPEDATAAATGSAKKIDLLLTDVIMPGMNGHELSVRISKLYPGIRILFMSGYTSDLIAHRGVLNEDVNFLQKPFTKKELALKLREILDSEK